eukprot:9906846-Heterocapsa_arctica.AAC.1
MSGPPPGPPLLLTPRLLVLTPIGLFPAAWPARASGRSRLSLSCGAPTGGRSVDCTAGPAGLPTMGPTL